MKELRVIRDLYRFRQMVEFEIESDEISLCLQIELFVKANDSQEFKANYWASEFLSVRPSTFKLPSFGDSVADEVIRIDYSNNIPDEYCKFRADSDEAALFWALQGCDEEIDQLWAGLSEIEQETVGRNRFIEATGCGFISWGGEIVTMNDDPFRASVFLGLFIANKTIIDFWLWQLNRLNYLLRIARIDIRVDTVETVGNCQRGGQGNQMAVLG